MLLFFTVRLTIIFTLKPENSFADMFTYEALRYIRKSTKYKKKFLLTIK